MIVDGTDLIITSRAPPANFPGTYWDYQCLWFSFKHRCSAIKYEVGVHFRTGRIVWINGPKRGAMNDITMARTLLTSMMLPGEMALADRGYVGDEHFVTPMKGRRIPVDITLEQLRGHVERVIGRIKFFKIIRDEYRGNLEIHPFLFDAVCRIVNINIDEAPIFVLPRWEFGNDFDEVD